MIILPKLRLGYQEVPKVGSTSIVQWLWGHLRRADPKAYADAALAHEPRMRRKLRDEASGNLTVANTAEGVAAYPDSFRFALTRDPVRRFVSMYRNRVVHFRELSATCAAAPALKRRGLPFDPQLNDLVEHWEAYAECGRSVAHHALGQMHFLGPDLGVYHSLTDLAALPEVVQRVRAHWAAAGLDALARSERIPKNKQAGGPELGIEALSPRSFEKLVHLYRDDYDALPTLDREAIAQAYAGARRDRPQADHDVPIVFAPASAREGGPADGAAAARGGVEADAERVTDFVRIKLEPAEPPAPAGSRFLKGVVMLKAGIDPAACRLFVRAAGAEGACAWPLPSLNMGREMPEHPQAAKARFRSKPMTAPAGTLVELMLTDAGGQTRRIASVQAP